MGFWDARLADLEARGEVFTDNEVRVLENGGMVLHMHPLEHADLEMRDVEVGPDGEVVLIPEVVHASGPHDPFTMHQWQYGNSTTETITMAELMRLEDSRWGTARADRWTDYPCYPGLLGPGEFVEDYFGMMSRAEDPVPYAFWNCKPIDDIVDADRRVLELKACTGEMVEEALYYEYREICDLGYNYYDPEQAWFYTFHRERMPLDNIDALLEEVASFVGFSTADEIEQHIHFVGNAFNRLYMARVLDSSVEDLAHNQNVGHLPWKPLTHYLEKRGCYEAADLWRQMTARRRLAIDRLPADPDTWGVNKNEVYE